MNQPNAIKQLFLDTNATYSLDDAASLLGWTTEELAAELSSQFVTDRDEWLVRPIPSFAIAVLAFADWSYEAIERALGTDASLLPPLVRLKTLTVRLPAYQIAALEAAASREQTTVSDILARELVELTTAEAPELQQTLDGFREAFHWPAPIRATDAEALIPATLAS
ncbi:MAG TPA: hypothetical protein VJZ00_11070 [Thermoanaerobaculia bacterium]|nr:hypothetical protein [Thermoanaerobaculia bacterium]